MCGLRTVTIATNVVDWTGMNVRLQRQGNPIVKVDRVLQPIQKRFNITICDGSCRSSVRRIKHSMRSASGEVMSRICESTAREMKLDHLPNCMPLFIRRDPVHLLLHVLYRSSNGEKMDYATVKDLHNADACMCA